MTRTLACRVFASPTRSYSRSCNRRSSLGCISQWQFPDFVQKKRAAVRCGHLAPGVAGGAGKSAFDPAEQFALEQFARKAGATDRDEGMVPLRAVFVDRPRQHRLAGAVFTQDHDGGRRRGGFEGQS